MSDTLQPFDGALGADQQYDALLEAAQEGQLHGDTLVDLMDQGDLESLERAGVLLESYIQARYPDEATSIGRVIDTLPFSSDMKRNKLFAGLPIALTTTQEQGE